MHDETADLMETLLFTVGLIKQAGDGGRRRLADAYAEAQATIAGIPLEPGSARPRIVACFEHFNVYKHTDHILAAAWMLTAIQQRIGERNLDGWPSLKIIADQAASLLRPDRKAMH
ncbi:hypothetical protein [Sinorhizobium sp. RAC02]|uniref:hypothetical protein n=1 Tax=Sinorhizobium sp. RAC02 TaxID=1842534 RepID=UPI00083E5614|nr:hypothetical protein [Sinorhizobium sp. RAC02]AOF92352.1 hypothetical protein BSY16_6111 [Sinorhizobium sp. RAC02]